MLVGRESLDANSLRQKIAQVGVVANEGRHIGGVWVGIVQAIDHLGLEIGRKRVGQRQQELLSGFVVLSKEAWHSGQGNSEHAQVGNEPI
jgi:hypothetical protein